jgi:hypothetical protein
LFAASPLRPPLLCPPPEVPPPPPPPQAERASAKTPATANGGAYLENLRFLMLDSRVCEAALVAPQKGVVVDLTLGNGNTAVQALTHFVSSL